MTKNFSSCSITLPHRRSLISFLAILTLVPSAPAWDGTGHRVIAGIAYDNLTSATRSRVDDLIKAHPDFANWIRHAPENPTARARWAFMNAAVWPDDIKGDPRFYDDTRKDAKLTPTLDGFPDMKRHTNWHYYDTPYTPDHAKSVKAPEPSALSELPRMIREIGRGPQLMAVYDLPWIEHIAGDVHQPLHCVTRILKSMPDGDAGGNRVFVAPRGNLHGVWDGALGRDRSDNFIVTTVVEIEKEHPAATKIEKSPKKWIKEGAELARFQVYTFGLETGTREHPVQLPAEYVENAQRVARAQMAIAGYRLAAVLNERLK